MKGQKELMINIKSCIYLDNSNSGGVQLPSKYADVGE